MIPVKPKVNYNYSKDKDFYKTLKTRVGSYFKEKGISTTGNTLMYLKSVFWFAVFFSSYGMIISNRFTAIEMIPLVMIFGFSMLLLSLNIAHDASHNCYSKNKKVNRAFAYVFELIGASSAMWHIAHNKSHHGYINIHEGDIAIAAEPFLRLSEDAPYRKHYRYQHIYGFLIYGLATFFWVFVKDFKYFRMRQIGYFDNSGHSSMDWVVLIFAKLFYFTYTLILPILLLDIAWWQVLVGFIIMHVTMGITLGITFQTTHAVEHTLAPKLDSNRSKIENTWATHVMESTSDFSSDSFILNWLFGGLNTHVAHHLFPYICHIHYPAITRIIKATAKEYDLHYIENKNMWAAIVSHIRHLKNLGKPPG